MSQLSFKSPALSRSRRGPTRRERLQEIDAALWATYRKYDRSAVMEKLLQRFLGPEMSSSEEAFLGNTWKTDEVLGMMDAIDEVIAVGIHPNERQREYTQPGYGGYGRSLTETLKPPIDTK